MLTPVNIKKRRNRGKKGKKPQGGKDPNSTGAVFDHPRCLPDYAISYRRKFRFLVGATLTAQTITYNNLTDLVNFCTAAVSLYNIFRAVKVHSVEMWDTSALGAASSVACLFNENDANLSGTQRMITDISMGVIPAHLKGVPAKGSLSSEWHVGFGPNTTQAFVLWSSASCVVDVDLSFRSGTTGTSNGASVACVGGIVGAVAFRGLDGLALATTKFICPIGVYQL